MQPNLDRAFAAFADPTRRAILARLAEGEATVSELAAPFDISLPAVSRHLSVLEAASLISQERYGQFRRCRLNADGFAAPAEWLEFYRRFWGESFLRLAEHLEATKPSKEKSHVKRRR